MDDRLRFTLTIPLAPKAQARDRIGSLKMKNGKSRGMSYKTKEQKAYEGEMEAWLISLKFPMLECAILLGVKAYMPIPKSYGKNTRNLIGLGELRYVKKPDLSNLIKNIEDIGNGILWKDDSQIVEYLPGTGKYYDDGHGPRWEIDIQTLDTSPVI